MHRADGLEPARRQRERPRRAQQVVLLPALVAQDRVGIGQRAAAEDDDPLAVAPEEVAGRRRSHDGDANQARPGLEPGTSDYKCECSAN